MIKTVIIGAGPAGITAAETLRSGDREMKITMISAEPFPPYSPPAMVEYFLTSRPVHFWKGTDITGRLGIDYRQGRSVRQIVPDKQFLVMDSGEKLDYDRLLIAAGAKLYAPLEGSDKKGINNFKSLLAGEEMLAKVRSGEVKSALIVGAGFIGVEIALLLSELGLAVTMLVRSRVMRGMLDPDTAKFVLKKLKEQAINVIEGPDADAVAFTGNSRAEAVAMRSGRELTADLLIAATGLKPNLELIEGSGINSEWGIIVNDQLQTNRENIFAAGDIAETIDWLSGERFAHANFPNAVAQGRVSGRNMLGHEITYTGSDRMNSLKHLGLPVMAAGVMKGDEIGFSSQKVIRKLWIDNNRIVGFRLAGDVNSAGIFLSLMRRKVNIEAIREILPDPGFGMGFLADAALEPAVSPALLS